VTNHYQSTRGEPRVALVLGPLAGRGIAAEAAVWDDPDVDWSAYDLVVLRSPWDHALRRDEFVAWAATVPTVPTSWVEPGQTWSAPADTEGETARPGSA
jgi:hypothetical protein